MKRDVMALVVLFCCVAGVVLVLGWMLSTALKGI